MVGGHWSVFDVTCCIDHCTLTNDHRPWIIFHLGKRYAMVTSFARYTSWIAFSNATPSCIGRWNAFLPEISPVPPARLLMMAVFTASFMSLSPDEAPPELIRPARPM